MQNTKSTLVIHPKDESTDCLSVIYEGKDWNVITDIHTTWEEIRDAIKCHDRLIFLGHGTPSGLLCANDKGVRFSRLIVDRQHIPHMKGKETFSIWCNSDLYFRGTGLYGLHTGMIVSEIMEEYAVFGQAPLSVSEMEENMKLFCNTFAKYIDLEPEEIKEKVLEEYVGSDPVTQYNRKNIITVL